jgi:hypothetical protein
MVTSAARRLAALRQPARTARFARALWIAWAVIIWNVVFDHVIVVAGRAYLAAAALAAGAAGSQTARYVNMDDWMRPAVSRALWIATLAAGVVLVVGLAAVSLAARAATSARPDPVGERASVLGARPVLSERDVRPSAGAG